MKVYININFEINERGVKEKQLKINEIRELLIKELQLIDNKFKEKTGFGEIKGIDF